MTPIRLLAIVEATSITGPAKNLLEFARQAAAENIATTIATYYRGPSDNVFTRAVLDLAARDSRIALELIPERGAFDPGVLRLLRELVARVRPDVLQTHAVKSHFLARAAGLYRYTPWVAFHHGYTRPTVKASAYNQIDRWSLRKPDRILTVSRPFRDQLVDFGARPERIEIVHNAIPAKWGEDAWGADSGGGGEVAAGKNIILIVGRLSSEKDHLTLLDAVHRLPAGTNPHLVIVGEGPERPRIEEKIRALGMTDRVTLTGHLSSAAPWYNVAAVAVLSSLSEGSPNALLEAMATNVPAVATAVGGIPEIVAHEESALLVKPGDAAGMSAAIERILTQPELAARLKANSRKLILEHYRPEIRMRKLTAIYRALAASSSQRR